MRKHLTSKKIIGLAAVVAIATPLIVLACVRAPSTPSVINDITATFGIFRR
jgi:hypothetical protein